MRDVIVVVVALVLAPAAGGCAVRAKSLPAAHPAATTAPTGRLAGAPPSLRPGVVKYEDVPAMRADPTPVHDHSKHRK